MTICHYIKGGYGGRGGVPPCQRGVMRGYSYPQVIPSLLWITLLGIVNMSL